MARGEAHERRALLFSVGTSLAVSLMAVTGVMLDNPGEVEIRDTVRSMVTLVAVSTLVPAALFAGGGLLRTAAYAFPLMLFLFFKFIGLYTLGIGAGIGYDRAVWASLVALVLIWAASLEPFRQRDPAKLGSFLFFVTASMAVASSAALAIEHQREQSRAAAALAALAPHVPVVPASAPGRALPDILYIVPDRYAGADAMRNLFDADAGAFQNALESRGFFVAEAARSNYPKTFLSLASTLNMTHLDPLIEAMGPESVDKKPVFSLVRNNAVQRELRSMGYTYVHLGSWWQATRDNPDAEQEFYGLDNFWASLNEFEHALLRTTPVAWLATYGGFIDRDECTRLKRQLDWLEHAHEASPGPLYAFAHLTLPHDPITMDKDGNCIPHVYYPGGLVNWDGYRAAYRGYVEYLNKRLLEIFDANKAGDDGRGLLFVVQADEGPYPRRMLEDGAMSLFNLSDDEIRAKFSILNAIYWDPRRFAAPRLTGTPVNNWRIIFSAITGGQIPDVTDERSILMHDDELTYDVTDVTDRFTPGPAARSEGSPPVPR